MTGSRRENLAVWAICLLSGLAIGISGFSADSNHPTYIPPALHYLDPTYLADDWWLAIAVHYHYAFFAIVAVLAKLGALEVGLALINAVVVAGALHACYRILLWLRAEATLTAITLIAAILLSTRAFFTAGNSYLFTASLQPSTLAAAATIAAMANFFEERQLRCGLWLAVAGLFHVNFLIANIPFFGLAFLLSIAMAGSIPALARKQTATGLLRILAPSFAVLALWAPLIFSVVDEVVAPSDNATADWVFFRFAVPFHYYPASFAPALLSFAGWELLGLLWTSRAVQDVGQRKVVLATQIALATIVWSATALTTVVFVPAISRLFLWRLAPFGVLLAAVLVIVGSLRLICSGTDRVAATPRDSVLLLGSILALGYTVVLSPPLVGQLLPTGLLPPAALVMGALLLLVTLRLSPALNRLQFRLIATFLAVLAFFFSVVTQPSDGKSSRYSLLFTTAEMREERELFEFVRSSTPANAQFLIPPDLDHFRLQARRPIVVDFKALPLNKTGLLSWYGRLEEISGTHRPANMDAVRVGFDKLDATRLDRLHSVFGIEYAVLEANQRVVGVHWLEVFRNASYRVLAYRDDGSRSKPSASLRSELPSY